MAEEIQLVMDFLGFLSKDSQLASNFPALTNVLEQLSTFIKVLPIVSAALASVKTYLPDSKREDILKEFEKLGSKIDQVRDDVKELEMTVKWESVKLQYGDVVNRITLGMSYCLEIGKAEDERDKMGNKERLEDLCSNQEFTLALKALMDGITGNGLFRSSILDELYQTTKGHRPKISALATRLLQLVCGGLMVNATYEAVKRGEEGALGMAKQFQEQLLNVNAKVQSVLRMCQENFRENMLSDLNYILDKDGSNEALLNELLVFMPDKYDWQEHFCLVYDDLTGFGYHRFSGDRVESLHRGDKANRFRRQKKCGIVFYRTAGEPPRFSSRYDEALQIAKEAYCYNAEKGYKNIVVKLAESRISWTGCAVIYHSANVRLGGNFSTACVNIVGNYAHVLILLE